MSTPALRRVLRRESHSPRTVAMVIAVALMILVLAYLGTEITKWAKVVKESGATVE